MRLAQTTTARVAGFRNTNTGQYIPLHLRNRLVLGSQPSCDITLSDPYVSKLHCVIERVGERWFIRDRESANGTFVNGYRVEGAELRVGTLVGLGTTRLVALADDSASGAPAVAGLIGQSESFRRSVATALKIAGSSCNVLLIGETGTGKELFAKMIHDASPRAAGPFVAVNCGAIPSELIASELFGHQKGSFTGASADRSGYFECAHQGTLFLDELGELPLLQQPALLRALETGVIRKVGAAHDMAVNVRVVAATNRLNLGRDAESRVRMDLYHRLATVTINLPPLRQRPEDIMVLVEYYLSQLRGEFGERGVSAAARDELLRYTWPGNVRELRHAVTRAVNLGGEVLLPSDFFEPSAPPQTALLVPQQVELRPYYPPMRRRAPRIADATAVPHRPAFDTSDEQLAPTATATPDDGYVEIDPRDVEYLGQHGEVRRLQAQSYAAYQQQLRDRMIAALEANTSLRGAARLMGMPKSTFISRARQLGILAPQLKR
ncbi:MAG: sigma 54-interacting transcriptional regulator [Myxococcales bacterium]|nr:sigma 54-interacting transcriptional regulator [Myxococcales bacterium]